MVIEGEARGRPVPLALHLMRTDTNESVNVLDIWGVDAPDVYTALREMHAIGAGARSQRTLYHANIDPRETEQFTEEQKRIAVSRLAEKLGMENQPRVVVEHVKKGRHHIHVVFGRIDLETMTAIPDSHNYRKHEELATELSREFGHEPVKRALTRDKANEPRPEPAPTYAEYLIAERSGLSPQEAKRLITGSWQQTTTGKELVERLAAVGFTMARGDRKDFVLIDSAGEIHGLTGRRVTGVKAAEIRERMADVDTASLPDVAEAKRLQFVRRQQQERDTELESGFVSSIERQREEEKPRAGGQLFANEAAAALHALNKTGEADLQNVVAVDDRKGADVTWQQAMRQTESIEARMQRDSDLAKAAALARSESRPPASIDVSPIAKPMPAAEAKPRAGLLQRLVSWVQGHDQEATQTAATATTAKRQDQAARVVAEGLPEAALRPSVSVEKTDSNVKTRTEPEHRPSAWLFVRIFGALIDAYQHALDRARADATSRQPAAAPVHHAPDKVRQLEHKPEAMPQTLPQEDGTKKPGAVRRESLADQIKREREEQAHSAQVQPRDDEARKQERAEAARRLREQEDRERERSLYDDDPRY